MDAFYVILFTLLVYVFLGTLTDVLIARTNATPARLKMKVLFHTFAAPITLLLLIFFVILTNNGAFNLYLGAGLIFGNLLRLIFADRKYLVSLHDSQSNLEVEYLTPLGKRRFLKLPTSDIGSINIEKANWLIDYPATLNITYQNEEVLIYIIDKQQKEKVQSDIHAANSSFASAGGDK
jgi:hypothetical protein